jgi:response regulator RpfG family c-di-GMP phosphodiesterase
MRELVGELVMLELVLMLRRVLDLVLVGVRVLGMVAVGVLNKVTR